MLRGTIDVHLYCPASATVLPTVAPPFHAYLFSTLEKKDRLRRSFAGNGVHGRLDQESHCGGCFARFDSSSLQHAFLGGRPSVLVVYEQRGGHFSRALA
jgi:hypothetical protein